MLEAATDQAQALVRADQPTKRSAAVVHAQIVGALRA